MAISALLILAMLNKMDKKKVLELRKKARLLEPKIRLGKLGVTESQIRQIKLYLKKHNLLKIRMLRSFALSPEKDEQILKLTSLTNSTIIDKTGNIIVIARKDTLTARHTKNNKNTEDRKFNQKEKQKIKKEK